MPPAGAVNRAYFALFRAREASANSKFAHAFRPLFKQEPGESTRQNDPFDIPGETYVNSNSLLGGRPMVGLQTLDLAIGVRVPASQPFAPS